jgi:peroxiredoxin
MGQTKEELAALRAERAATPQNKAVEISRRAIEELQAGDLVDHALRAGSLAPEFTLPDQNGSSVNLRELLVKGPVVVSFYRGAWCPFCNIELRGLQRSFPRMRELGASLVAISPQLPDGSLTLSQRHALEFPILSDLGNSVARSYGIVFRLSDELRSSFRERGIDLARANGDGGGEELPVPAMFVLSSDGFVHSAFVNVDHTDRTDPDEIVAILESLQP